MALATETKQADPVLASKLEEAQDALLRERATKAAQRLALTIRHADTLPVDSLRRLVDVPSCVEELAEVRGRKARFVTTARNFAVLLPLLMTWLALAIAAGDYQRQLAADPTLLNQPFLLLWQNGFGGTTWFTFSVAAWVDLALLAVVLGLTIGVHVAEYQADRGVARVREQLEGVLEQLTAQSMERPLGSVGTDPQKWADAVRIVIDGAMQQTRSLSESLAESSDRLSRQVEATIERVSTHWIQQTKDVHEHLSRSVAETLDRAGQAQEQLLASTASRLADMFDENGRYLEAQTQQMNTALGAFVSAQEQMAEGTSHVLDDLRQTNQALVQDHMVPVISQFRAGLGDLHLEIAAYHKSAASVTEAVAKLREASAILAAHAGGYTGLAQAIDVHLDHLNDELGHLLADQRTQELDMKTDQRQNALFIAESVKTMKSVADAARVAVGQLDPALMYHAEEASGRLATAGDALFTASTRLDDATRALYAVDESLKGTTRALEGAAERLRNAIEGRPGRPFWRRLPGLG